MLTTGISLAIAVGGGVFRLSATTVMRPRDMCSVWMPATAEQEAFEFQLPSHPHEVTEIASWRWPAIIATLAVLAVAVGMAWAKAPKLGDRADVDHG